MTHASPALATALHDDGYGSAVYRWYVLGVLTLIYACHALDRGVPNIVLELVKQDFALSDGQVGLFTGTLFGIAFALAGVPLGFVSDRVNRRNMLGIILVAWSAFTSLGGFAASFPLLLASRFAVGAAEAGAAPIAMPMLSDIFPPERRATVIGLFYMSNPIAGIATAAAAVVAAKFGWQAAVLLAGAPGLVLALLLFATVREPARGASEGAATQERASAGEVLRFLAGRPGLLLLMLGCALSGFVAISTGAWAVSFYTRVHGLALAEIAPLFAGVGFLGLASYPLVGFLGDRAARRHERGPLLLVATICAGGAALGILALHVPSAWVAIPLWVAFGFFTHAYTPPAYAALMAKTPPHLRGVTMSTLQLTTNLFGFGIGPAWVGAMSDVLGGGAAIRSALSVAVAVLFVAGACLFGAARLLYPSSGRVAVRSVTSEAP
ncbi:MAG TPA: MFS transporter [Myxococcota bacterium]|nr:MFS transporter [Myxococcota bacterium]